VNQSEYAKCMIIRGWEFNNEWFKQNKMIGVNSEFAMTIKTNFESFSSSKLLVWTVQRSYWKDVKTCWWYDPHLDSTRLLIRLVILKYCNVQPKLNSLFLSTVLIITENVHN